MRGPSSVKIQIEIVSAWLLRILKRLARQEEFNGRRPYLRFFLPQIEYLSVLFVIGKISLVQCCLVNLRNGSRDGSLAFRGMTGSVPRLLRDSWLCSRQFGELFGLYLE